MCKNNNGVWTSAHIGLGGEHGNSYPISKWQAVHLCFGNLFTNSKPVDIFMKQYYPFLAFNYSSLLKIYGVYLVILPI